MKSQKRKSKDEETIIREITAYSGSKYFAEFIFAIRGFVIAKFLGPSLYGLWNILRVFLSAGDFVSLGSVEAMTRQIPKNAGAKTQKNNESIAQTTLSWTLLGSIFITILTFILTLTGIINENIYEVRLTSILFIGTSLYFFVSQYYRSHKKIFLISKISLAYAILNTVVGLSFLFFYEVIGLLYGMLVSYILIFIYVLRRKDITLKLSIDKTRLKALIRMGFPIMLLTITFFLMHKIDSIIVFAFLGSAMTGYYGLASFITLLVQYIPQTFTAVLFPRMMHKFGREKKKRAMLEYFTKPLDVLATTMPLLLGVIFINVDAIIVLILEQYIPAIMTLKILIVSLFFSAIQSVPNNILIGLNKQKKLMYVMVTILGISAVLDIAMVMAGYGIEGVAIATGISMFLASMVSLVLAAKELNVKKTIILKSLHSPIYAAIIIAILSAVIIHENIFIKHTIETLLFILLYSPKLLKLNKRMGLADKVLRSLTQASTQKTRNKKGPLNICALVPKAYPLFNPKIKSVFGGAESQMSLLSKQIAKVKNINVSMVVQDHGQKEEEIIKRVTLHKSFKQDEYTIQKIRKLRKAMDNVNADVYIQRTLTPWSFFLALYANLKGKAFIYMVAHDAETDGGHELFKNPLFKYFTEKMFILASLVVVQNEYEYENLKKLSKDIHCTIMKKGLIIPTKEKATKKYDCIWVGRCDEWKRPEVFLNIARLMPDKKFLIICPPATNKKRYFDRIVSQAESIPNVEFIKYAPNKDVKRYMEQSKVFMLTSTQEGDWPMVVLEACSTSLPIISYELEYGRLISEYQGGICVKNQKTLITTLNKLLKDTSKRNKMGANAFKYLKEHHDITKQAQKLVKLIREAEE